jgi:hypothetical protein
MASSPDRAGALLAKLRIDVESKLSTHDLEPAAVAVSNDPETTIGTKMLFMVEAQGVRYIVKAADPPLAQAEETASKVLGLGGRAVIPARRFEGEVGGVGLVQGVLKPFLEFDGSRTLPTDTSTWSDDQRLVMLALHPWEWFLDNLDANQSQYALIGDDALPMMIDWDRAFHRAGEGGLSRFDQHRPNLPNLRNFLYADYVEARVDLELSVLVEEAKRIAELPEAEVRPLLERYAEVRFDDISARRAFVRRFVQRRRTAIRDFKRFAAELERERRLQTAARLPVEHRIPLWWRRAFRHFTQALNAVVRGPIGDSVRALLRWVRAKRTVRPM